MKTAHRTAEAHVLQASRQQKVMLAAGCLSANMTLVALLHHQPWMVLVPLLLIANAGITLTYHMLLRAVITPLQQMHRALRNHPGMMAQADIAMLNLSDLAAYVQRLSDAACRDYQQQQRYARELDSVRRSMAELTEHHAILMRAAERETRAQYQSVMTYACYLEERILAKQADASLRFDFDDTCESSFALALLSNALIKLNAHEAARPTQASLSLMLQHTLIKLSAALDRRSMRLDSSSVDVTTTAYVDIELVQLAVWIMLLGTVRYAEDESTLKLRTLTSRDGKSAIVSIVVSELSPGALNEQERAQYLEQLIHQHSPHLFAQAIASHANMRLVNMLLARTGGHAEVTPLTATCCEIVMRLPHMH